MASSKLRKKTLSPERSRASSFHSLAIVSKSVDDENYEVTETDFTEDSLESNISLTEIVKNVPEENLVNRPRNCLELNAILRPHTGLRDKGPVQVYVETNEDSNYMQFTEGYIVFQGEQFLWMRFFVRLEKIDFQKLLYNYILWPVSYSNLANDQKAEYIREFRNDEDSKLRPCRYDGILKFQKSGTNELLSPEALKQHNINSIEIYSKALLQKFLPLFKSSKFRTQMQETWANILLSFHDSRLKRGLNIPAKRVNTSMEKAMERALSIWYGAFFASDYKEIFPLTDKNVFKLAIALILVHVEVNQIQSLAFQDCRTFLEWISKSVTNEEEKDTLSQVLVHNLDDLPQLCQYLRRSCEQIVNFSTNFTKDAFFTALLEWAYLDGHTKPLKISCRNYFTKEVLLSREKIYKSRLTLKNLLLLAVSSHLDLHDESNFDQFQLDAVDLLSCLAEHYINQKILSRFIIQLLENSKDDPVFPNNTIEDLMSCLQALMGSILMNGSNLYLQSASEENRIIFKRFLHVALDMLSVYDAYSEEENYSQITDQFYKFFSEFISQLNEDRPVFNFDSEDVFHWANVLAHRKGFRPVSRSFLDTQMERLIQTCFDNEHIINSVPKLCRELPAMVQKSVKMGFRIKNFDNLQNVLVEVVIRSIPKNFENYASDENFLQLLQDRKKIVDAFCCALEKQIPLIVDSPSLVITNIMTFMNFKYCSIILQISKNQGAIVQNTMGSKLVPFIRCFGEISQRLESADISLEEFESLESKQACFEECLEIICEEEAESVKRKFNSVKVFRDNLINTMQEVETFKGLAEKWQSIGIQLSLSVFRDGLQDWKSRPMQLIDKFRRDNPKSNYEPTRRNISLYEFYIEMMESIIFQETCYQVFNPVFGSPDNAVPYRDMTSNKIPVFHEKYLKKVKTFVHGPLTFTVAKQLFPFPTDEEKEKEIEFIFKFYLREKPDSSNVENLKKLRIKQIGSIESMERSVGFIHALNRLVLMLAINPDQSVLSSFQKMESLDNCNICDLGEAVIDLCFEFAHFRQKNLTAINQFIDEPDFHRWIKSKIQSPQELAFVIELANLSSTDLGNDEERVQDFFNAIYGYGPFIYSLTSESTFRDIREAYKRVFENLKENPRLPEQYAKSALDRPWFERVLETLGSAETKAVDAAISINKGGIYKIRYDKNHSEEEIKTLSPQDVVTLDYIQPMKESSDSKNDVSKHLWLNDLKDLYSWLMLIVRKEKLEEAETVDTFERTFRNIEILASHFVSLYNSGCSFFHGWSVVVRTRSSEQPLPAIEVYFGGRHFDPLVSSDVTCDFDLSQLCLTMESIKRKWENYVFDMRKSRPTLNSFNGQQLRILCSGLAQTQFTNETALFYLQTLNANLTFEKVQLILDEYEEQQYEEERARPDSIYESSEAEDNAESEVDDVSRLIGALEALKKYGWDETLAKAALYMTGYTTESEALNWIIDNQDDDGVDFENYADQFDQHYASLAPTNNTETSDQDRTPLSQLAHNVEKRFDSYLNLSKQNHLRGLINLEQLDYILEGCMGEDVKTNEFMPGHMKNGQPNLVVCKNRSEILPQVVSMYRFILIDSLPKYTQILMCSSETTCEEVEVFVLRALKDPNSRVHSMVFADELEINCANYLEKLLFDKLNDVDRTYKLVVFVRDETSPVSKILEKFKKELEAESSASLRQYICNNLKTGANRVDNYKSRLITSTQPSSGKSLYIAELETKLKGQDSSYKRIILRLCEKKINFGNCLDILWQHRLQKKPTIIHLDISCNIKENVEEFIFSLCILGGIQDSRGKLFVTRNNFLVCIEMLDPAVQVPFAKNSILLCLPSGCCLSPNQYIQQNGQTESGDQNRLITNESFIHKENFQRPYQYLTLLEKEQDVTSYSFSMLTQANNNPRELCEEVIKTLIKWSGLPNPTWSQLTYFANFLNEQLELCENNFFATDRQFRGFKNFLIKHCIVKMGQDFALPSLSVADHSPSFGINEDHSVLKTHQIRRRWENHAHPYVFFNADNATFTFLGVKVENTNLLSSKGGILAENAMPLALEKLIRNQAYDQPDILGENFDELTKAAKMKKLQRVLGIDENSQDVDSNYELTQDNVMKLLAIYMRFKCNIPVVIIGETGCGKTRLIEYLCSLLDSRPEPAFPNKKIVKVHGGVTAEDIARNVKEAEKQAKENFKQGVFTVLFFDEANTTEAIHVIKEVVCDFTIGGEMLDQNCGLKIVVACNPYRKHNQKMIEKLESAGLGFHLSPNVDDEKLDGGVPMRHLVYRVNPLPPSLLPLAWDFGRLTIENENKYIEQIVWRHGPKLHLQKTDVNFIREVFCMSQKFLRQNEELSLSVSLRHIDRAMNVLKFFYKKQKILLGEMDKLDGRQSFVGYVDTQGQCNPKTLSRLVVLTIGACYYFSLDDERDNYLAEISNGFTGKYALPDNERAIKRELELCQNVFVHNLKLSSNMTFAKNKALAENVFMMFICIQTNIPLFLVGKPGSSKSLAKTIIIDAMQGKHSPSQFFRHFKQAHVLSYQCSPHTTAEGIVNTFKQATQYQKRKDLKSFTSVVVLDEIGLAEASAKMPLKALHPLLEEGYVEEGKEPSEHSKVAFIGISNWALDPAKMSRGILVSRTRPDHKELLQSARAICRVDYEGSGLATLIEPISKAYEEIYEWQLSRKSKEILGLRDFYGLLKMLYCEYVRANYQELSFMKVCKAICRNFCGRKSFTLPIFIKHCQNLFEKSMMIEVAARMKTLDLVRDNIEEADRRLKMSEELRRMDNESRYLLLMTENFAALQLLPNVLNVENCEIIFGSSFPQDREYIDVCRNINKIKMCMESGIPVVLLNIGFVYESLYDALNQHYVYYGKKRLVDLGLGSNRVKCSVSEKFRLIIIEEEEIAKQFPIPLLNRLEKQWLGIESILTPAQREVVVRLTTLMAVLSDIPRSDVKGYFKIRDVFIGFVRHDTAAYIILQVYNDLNQDEKNNSEILFRKAFQKASQICTEEAVMRIAKQAATPNFTGFSEFFSPENLKDLYIQQGRRNLSELLQKQCYSCQDSSKCRFIEVTTFCGIPSSNEIKLQNRDLMRQENATMESDERHCVINLNWMKTEQEFTGKVNEFLRLFKDGKYDNVTKCLFLTCAKGQKHVPLIACAKYCLENVINREKVPKLCVILIIELPRNWYVSNYSSFCVGQWDCFHIDSLLADEEVESLRKLLYGEKMTLKELFHVGCEGCSHFQKKFIREVIYETVAESSVDANSSKVVRIANALQLFDGPEIFPGVEELFMNKLASFLYLELGENTEIGDWVLHKAASLQDLIEMGSLKNVILVELKQKAKPHMLKFLNAINFDNNLRLLLEEEWCKNLWINLFSLMDAIAIKGQIAGKSMQLAIEFPFSTYVINEMEDLFEEIKDSSQNRPTSEVEKIFLETLEKDEICELWKILRNMDDSRKLLDAFINDLIIHELNVTAQKDKRDLLKFIRHVVIQKMRKVHEIKPSFGLAFLVFHKMKSELKFIRPLVRIFTVGISRQNFDSLTVFILTNAIEILMHKVDPQLNRKAGVEIPMLEFKRQELELFLENLTLVKNCSKDLQNDEQFQEKLEKLSIFSYYVTEISNLPEPDAIQEACKGAQMLWSSMNSMTREEISSEKFIRRLIFALQTTSDAVLSYCLTKEVENSDCAFCRTDVVKTSRKQGFPISLPCKGNHPVHPECWTKKLEEISSYDDNLDSTATCLLCQNEIEVSDLKACKTPSLKFVSSNLSRCWTQSIANVRNVFLGLAKDVIIPRNVKNSLHSYAEYCIVKKNGLVSNPYFFDEETKYVLLFTLVKQAPVITFQHIEMVLTKDFQTETRAIDVTKTMLLVQNVVDSTIFGGFFDKLQMCIHKFPRFIVDVIFIAQIKDQLRTLSNFIFHSLPGFPFAVGKDFQIPPKIEEILTEKGEIAENMKRSFRKCIYMEGGEKFLNKVEKNLSLARMFPKTIQAFTSHELARNISEMELKPSMSFWDPLPNLSLHYFQSQLNETNLVSFNFPVLAKLFDDDLEIINCLKRIPTLLEFFRSIIELVNDGDLSKSFSDILSHSNLSAAQIEKLDQGAKIYLNLWNKVVRFRLYQLKPEVKCSFDKELSAESPMKFFIAPRTQGNDCCAWATLFFLISKNNEIILRHRSCFNIETPIIYLDESAVTRGHVVAIDDVETELRVLISTFTSFGNKSDFSTAKFDFKSIERLFCHKFCAFKPLINPKILKFTNKESRLKEALQNARSLGKTKPLSKTTIDKIIQSFTRMPDVCYMLKQVELLMNYLDKTSTKENDTISLGDFMLRKLRKKFVSGIQNVEVSQIASLWQHLALQKTCLMSEHSGEDPFLGISSDLKYSPLTTRLKRQLEKLEEKKKENLMIQLNEFILVHLYDSDSLNPESSIEESLDQYFNERTDYNLHADAKMKFAEEVMKHLLVSTKRADIVKSDSDKQELGFTYTNKTNSAYHVL